MPEPERTALYRHFDANGDLLYIGISKDPEGRWMAHRGNREPWIHQAVRRIDEWYNSRPEALAAETKAIRAERPPFNGTHNHDDAPFDPASWSAITDQAKVPAIAGLIRAEIASERWSPGQRLPSLRTMGEAVGAHMRIVSQASVLLQQEGLLDFRPGLGLFVARQPVVRHRGQRPKLPHDFFYKLGFPG
ncbi:GntR family transcriptional regulator [Streptomyces canus]|uniref:GntR family transcriptional regulator n=1 Tax=Streptomyces canus TaxID=58343 RepID=UPI002781E8EF|nr:GntR family transcriptional regulator [Streptomyces canus]MDQ0758737.1 putative GIY-YIG superfamily endonuclease [Streptomyces canus]